jgi:hypothetical protein
MAVHQLLHGLFSKKLALSTAALPALVVGIGLPSSTYTQDISKQLYVCTEEAFTAFQVSTLFEVKLLYQSNLKLITVQRLARGVAMYFSQRHSCLSLICLDCCTHGVKDIMMLFLASCSMKVGKSECC